MSNIGSTPLTIPLDDSGRIAADVACRKCGYNLRGLAMNGRCPECGTAVGRSVHGDLLRYCDPVWVRTLASGLDWIGAGILIGFILGLCGGGVMVAMAASGSAGPHAMRWVGAIAPLFGIIGLIGYWKATTPDPGQAAEPSGLTARKLVRITQAASFCVTPAAQIAMQTNHLAGMGISLVLAGIGFVGTVALFSYSRGLALRIPNERLASNTRRVMWGLIVTQAIAAVSVTLEIVFVLAGVGPTAMGTAMTMTTTAPATIPAYTPGAGLYVPAAFGCASGVLGLIFGIWAIVLIFQYRRALHEAADAAGATWAAAG